MNIVPKTFFFNCLSLYFLFISSGYAEKLIVNHQLQVDIDPHEQTLLVRDRIRIEQPGPVEFVLHADLHPRSDTPDVRLNFTGKLNGEVPLETWRITRPESQTEFTLSYGGKIAHTFNSRTEAPGKQQQLLAGTISREGVFLDAGVAWYPLFPSSLQTFSLSITLPDNWLAVSQGEGPLRVDSASNTIRWREDQPQPDIYLVAGQFHQYARAKADTVTSQVFLRQPDAALAQRYLDVTRDYIDRYEALIGRYPYDKFALVENFWETGYGMPSFTLLGPTVIRLPFILHSAYPHEILHNWWGNGVYVNYTTGNWSEGLTTYLADHLISEQSGRGIDYRRNTLQRYASFVRSDNDFPLSEFRARHNEGSQAVGYGKGMMLFHMLRRKLGDQAFIEGLRTFYADNLFKIAGYEQIKQAFEKTGRQSLDAFFEQWLDLRGAPKLDFRNTRLEHRDGAYMIRGEVYQTQNAPAFDIDIPLIVYFEGDRQPEQHSLHMDGKKLSFSIPVTAQAARVDFDPWFDLFRILHPAEVPPTLAGLFGSTSVLFVLPSRASDELKNAYQDLAQQWAAGYDKAVISYDNEVKTLEGYPAVWLLGEENLFNETFVQKLHPGQFSVEKAHWLLDGAPVNFKERSLVLTQRHQADQIFAWVIAASPTSVKGLSRKLPHYGKYSYLAFEGEAPTIRHKGQWSIDDSPLKFNFTDAVIMSQEMKPPSL